MFHVSMLGYFTQEIDDLSADETLYVSRNLGDTIHVVRPGFKVTKNSTFC